MSVLKIKDQNNNWTQIPTIKGEKGDPFTYADFTPEQLESIKGKDGISPTVSVASDMSDDYRLSFTDETHTVTTPNLIPEAEKIFDVYPTDTASGSIASFPDGADDIPLKSCIVQIEPVQEGSGDPSPDNIRPITGWTGCVISHSGEDASNPTTYPITFPSEAGIVYGAYIDVTGGELVVDKAIVDLGTCNIAEFVDTSIMNHLYYAILPDRLPYYANNGEPVFLKCSALKPIEKTRAIGYLKTIEPNTVAIRQTYTDRIYIKSETDTVEAMKQSLDGVQFVYPLATPIHYPITSNQINSLYGQNNLWANTGDTEVEYRASTKMYIDRKITEAVASALNS